MNGKKFCFSIQSEKNPIFLLSGFITLTKTFNFIKNENIDRHKSKS